MKGKNLGIGGKPEYKKYRIIDGHKDYVDYLKASDYLLKDLYIEKYKCKLKQLNEILVLNE